MNRKVYIVADIGGTNARFAFVTSDSDQLQHIECYACSDFPTLADAYRCYKQSLGINEVSGVCLAVAGPVENDPVDLPNSHWTISRSLLAQELSTSVSVINDFTAQTLSIDALGDDDLVWLGKPRPPATRGVKAVIGPGTGLGVAAMLSEGAIVPSEGGHVAFAPSNEHEMKLLQLLWERYERVSVERLLSGMGLENLYWANAKLQGVEKELAAPEIAAGAAANDELCLKTIEDFFAIMASVAGDTALMMGAVTGVYISGGIVPRLREYMNAEAFRKRFEDKGRFGSVCANMPVALVIASQPGLTGCVEAIKLEV